jgi:hypothetical protein
VTLWGIIILATHRAASKLVTNRFLFGDRFDQPGGRSEALHFSDRKRAKGVNHAVIISKDELGLH